MLKKSFIILIMLLMLVTFCNRVNATEIKTSLNIIQKASETKYLENNQGYISKEIVDSNVENGEVTIELKINNNKKEQENTENYENTEIYLMVSENIVNNEETLTNNINNIEKLVTKIFNKNSKTKVGIIGIKGTINDSKLDEETGKLITGDKDERKVNGSVNDAEIVVGLTNSLDTIKNGLQNMNSSKTKYRANLQAAIRLANKSYSNNTNKILISLYDNVPDIAIGVPGSFSYRWLI